MPYPSLADLPPAVKKLPEKKQRQWRAVFNSTYPKEGETRAFQNAWAAVNKDILEKQTSILKTDDELRIVYGVVLEPGTEDLQGDILDEQTIEKAAHEYLRESRVVGDSHMVQAPADVVESYIAQSDLQLGDQSVKKGSWIMGVKVRDDEMWAAVKKGEFTGFSIGGFGTRTPIEKAAQCKCPECGHSGPASEFSPEE